MGLARKPASATEQGEMTTGAQIIAGAKAFLGLFTPTGGISGKVDGAAIAAGMIGETPGTTPIAGVGGSIYTLASSTLIGTSATTLLSLPLNKGNYLFGFIVTTSKALDATTPEISVNMRIGGTNVGVPIGGIYAAGAGCYLSGSKVVPLIITVDNTIVSIVASQTIAIARITLSECWALRQS